MLHLDRALWYSGWDGELWAELVPSVWGWYVVLLGQGLFATTDRCYLDAGVVPLLREGGFRIEEAVWSFFPSQSYSSNPFLCKAPIHQCLQLASLGNSPLPVDHNAYPLQIFSQPSTHAPPRSMLCFVITQDSQFIRWGKSRNPHRFLAQLQQQSPQSLRLLGTLKKVDQAKNLEQKFGEFKSIGNWYYFRGELAKQIEQLLSL